MKNFKSAIALILAVLMTVPFAVISFAAEEDGSYAGKIRKLCH